MPLETGTYISDLVATNPPGSDNLNQADDHLRLIKSTVKTTFPNVTGAVTPTQAQLNQLAVAGIKSASPSDGVGYATGAGGTVTQASTKGTAVTLNKICGQITTASDTLNAGASASFTVSSSACAVGDVVVACVSSPAGSYRVDVTAQGVVPGNFNLTLTNISIVNLSQAVVINFAIIKAVTS